MGLFGGSTRMGIGLTVTLRDHFSKRATAVKASMNGMAAGLSSISRASSMAMMTSGAAMAAAGGAVVMGYASMVKAAAEYEHTLKAVKAVTGSSVSSMGELDAKAQQVAGNTVHTLHQVADAMKFMGMAGMSKTEIIQTMDSVSALAEATGHVLSGKGGSADIMTNIIRAFDLTADSSERVADILAKGTLSANTSLFDMGEAIKYTAATAMDLNVGLEETTAMIMAMGNAGIQASMAGTAVENMLRYITTAASGRATKGDVWALAQLGMSPKDLQDSNGNLKEMGSLLALIKKRAVSLGTVDRQAVFQEIFGVRGKRAGSQLIRALGDYKSFLGELKDIEPGYASKVAEERRNTIKGDLLLLASAWSKFQVAATNALYYVIRPLLFLTRMIVEFGKAILEIPYLGTILAGVVVTAGALLGIFGGILMVVGTMAFMFNQLKIAVVSLRAVVAAANIASLIGWSAKIAAARVYLATLGKIAAGEVMTSAGGGTAMLTKAGKFTKGIGKLGILQTLVLWGGRIARGFMMIGSFLLGPLLAGLSGVAAVLAPFVLGILAVVAGAAALYAGFKALAWWIDSKTEDNSVDRSWNLEGMEQVSAKDYYNNPDAFNKSETVIKYNPTVDPTEVEQLGGSEINVYIDGSGVLKEKIDAGSSKDIYAELGE